MASINFRFTTECEMTLEGGSYEEIYLQFKDFMHGNQSVASRAGVKVYPPESVQVFFNIESRGDLHEIPQFKGSFKSDIGDHCEHGELLAHQTSVTYSNPEHSKNAWRFW